ncbi:MAG: DUF2380 domain-containing protein [Rhizobiaceae bacterium]
MALLRPLLAALVAAVPVMAHAEAIPLGFTPFSFTDTSGEVRDQTSEHERRLAAFVETLKAELAKSGKFEMADVACPDTQCPPDEALAKAKSAGSRYVVLGAIQKTSTLVLWARVDVIDSNTSKVALSRWITFRGDNDEAWTRTARFVGRAINAALAG